MTDRLPDGVVFDCDGTLVDTEPISDANWTRVLARYGYEPTAADFGAVVGHPWPRSYAHFAGRVPLPPPDVFRSELRASFLELFATDARLFPDAAATVRGLAEAGVAVGVCTSSSRSHLDRVLALEDIGALVTASVAASDTDEHKPLPAPYLEACRRLGVDPAASSAVEDTEIGARAALAAGLFTVAVDRGTGHGDLTVAHRVVGEVTLDAVRPPGDEEASA